MNTLPQLRTGNSLLLVDPHAGHQTVIDLTVTLALRGHVRIFDMTGRFDVNRLTRPIRRHTPHVLNTLTRVTLARAFSCYEAAGMTEAHIERIKDGDIRGDVPLVILDFLAPYLDEAISTAKCYGLFKASLNRIQELATLAPILITARPPRYCPPSRAGLLALLCEAADRTVFTNEPVVPITQLTLWERAEGRA